MPLNHAQGMPRIDYGRLVRIQHNFFFALIALTAGVVGLVVAVSEPRNLILPYQLVNRGRMDPQ
jgi:hypothetical protein